MALAELNPVDVISWGASKAKGAIDNAIKNVGAPATDTPPQKDVPWYLSSSLIMVILGLLLVAAGIFSFDKTRELVVTSAKHGARLAEGAAAAAA